MTRCHPQVLRGLLDALTNKEMFRRLNIPPRTVDVHRARLAGRLGFRSVSQAVQFAIDAELVPSSEAAGRGPGASRFQAALA